MPTSDDKFAFNMASHAYYARLSERDREAFELMQREHQQERERYNTDYIQNRDDYIDKEHDRLMRHYRLKLDGPRPPGFVVRRIPTGPEIRQEAIDRVRERHQAGLLSLDKEAKIRERTFLERALGLAPRGRDRGGLER